MYTGLHVKHLLFFQILVNLEFSGQIFEKYSNSKFHAGARMSRVVQRDGRTDGET